ncbi:MAG: TetR/AcrR family transcriptional regulator [Acidimicrobiia bacterium]
MRSDVLRASAELLAENGYDGLSIEAVAARAGVHKTTVYRRWPTKAELVADTLSARSEDRVPVPDTGTFAGDLRALARAVAANIGSDSGSAMTRTLIAASVTSADVADTGAAFWADRLRLTGAIVDRAISRGEVPEHTDANLVIETLVGPLYVRLLLTGEPVDAGFADRVAALVAAGASVPPA